jgi:RNA recognition motif-containing protein
MEAKLYVGGLSYDTTEDELRTLFAQAGTVRSVHIATDRDSGRSRGFGFVEMGSQSEMDKAIHMFNGSEMNGRSLTVNQARPREDRRGGGGGGGGGGGWRDDRRSGGGNRGGGRRSW